MSDELREAAACVTSGNAKLSECIYGDDGVDMARDIQAVMDERDRYRAIIQALADCNTVVNDSSYDDSGYTCPLNCTSVGSRNEVYFDTLALYDKTIEFPHIESCLWAKARAALKVGE